MTKDEMRAEALDNARNRTSLTNYPAIYQGFAEKGIAYDDIKPRENVFTFQAWQALGRAVKKGEHGVRVVTFVPVKDKDTGEITGRAPHTTVVFHVSQTETIAERDARWAANKANKPNNTGRQSYRRNSWNKRPNGPDPYKRNTDQSWRNDPGELAADRWNEMHGDR